MFKFSILELIDFVGFLHLCWHGYREARTTGKPYYGKVTCRGVPQINVVVATNRTAWEVESVLMEHFELKAGDA